MPVYKGLLSILFSPRNSSLLHPFIPFTLQVGLPAPGLLETFLFQHPFLGGPLLSVFLVSPLVCVWHPIAVTMKAVTLFAAVPTVALALATGLHNSQRCHQAALGHHAPRCNDVSLVKQARQADDDDDMSSDNPRPTATRITLNFPPSGTLTVSIGDTDESDADVTITETDSTTTTSLSAPSRTSASSASISSASSASASISIVTVISTVKSIATVSARAIQADTVTITASDQFTSLVGTSVNGDAVPSGPIVVTISTSTITYPGVYSLDPTFISYSTTTQAASTTVFEAGPTTSIGAIIDPRPGGFTIINGMPYDEWTSQNPGAFITYTTGPGQGTSS